MYIVLDWFVDYNIRIFIHCLTSVVSLVSIATLFRAVILATSSTIWLCCGSVFWVRNSGTIYRPTITKWLLLRVKSWLVIPLLLRTINFVLYNNKNCRQTVFVCCCFISNSQHIKIHPAGRLPEQTGLDLCLMPPFQVYNKSITSGSPLPHPRCWAEDNPTRGLRSHFHHDYMTCVSIVLSLSQSVSLTLILSLSLSLSLYDRNAMYIVVYITFICIGPCWELWNNPGNHAVIKSWRTCIYKHWCCIIHD